MKKLSALLILSACLALLASCGRSETVQSAPEDSALYAQAETVSPDESDPEASDVTAEQNDYQNSSVIPPSPSPSPSAAAEPSPSPFSATEPTALPGEVPSEAPTEGPIETEEPASLPYSVKTADTVLTVFGSETDREWYFTLTELQSMGGTESASYFSKGKEPQELTNDFTGINVRYLIEQVVGISDYKKVMFTAADGYAVGYSRSGVNASYMNEKDPSASLNMILAWSEDGTPCSLRLVMGQQVEGEYNRTNWARDVISIEVRAS